MAKYPGINYAFRPSSYWDAPNPSTAILRNVTGENRRKIIAGSLRDGNVDELPPALLQDETDEGTRDRLGQIHPSFLGGEFLPGYLSGEVEIARICLQSTTCDVITLRARPTPGGIAYRVEDEYEGEFTLPFAVSAQPLTLGEMIQQFEQGRLNELDAAGGLALGYNNLNAEGDEYENLRHFTVISSTLYRQLEEHFEYVFEDWVTQACAERDGVAREEGGEP